MGGMNSSPMHIKGLPIRVETYNYNWFDVIKNFRRPTVIEMNLLVRLWS